MVPQQSKTYRWIHGGLICFGIILIFILCYTVGFRVILDSLEKVKFHFFAIVSIALGWHFFNTLAWFTILPRHKDVSFFKLLRVKIKGEAFNALTPFGVAGGEPLRVWLIHHHYSVREGTVSVILDKAINFFSGFCFLMFGLPISLSILYPKMSPLYVLGGILCALFLVVIFVDKNQGKFLFLVLKLIRFFRLTFLDRFEGDLIQMDDYFSHFYRSHKKKFLLCFVFNITGLSLGAFEIFYILWVLDSYVSYFSAYLIETFIIFVNIFSVFIPGSLGAAEGGIYLFLSALGFSPEIGLSLGLIRRIRIIFWSIVGVIIPINKR